MTVSEPAGELMSGKEAMLPNGCNKSSLLKLKTQGYSSRCLPKSCVETRVFKTIAIYACALAMGLASPILGTTKVHMELLLNTTSKNFAFVFSAHPIGYLVGSFVCGLIYDRCNKEFFISLFVLVEGLTMAASPFVGNLGGFITMMALVGLARGVIDTGYHSYCVNLWTGHGYKEMIYQACHALWSVGAMIGPFLIQPFLIELTTRLHSNSSTDFHFQELLSKNSSDELSTELNVSRRSYVIPFNENFSTSNFPVNTTDMDVEFNLEALDEVRYAYIVIGALILVPGVMFAVMYLRRCSQILLPRSVKRSRHPKEEYLLSLEQRKATNFVVKYGLFAMLFFVYFVYACIETIPNAYYSSFAIQYLHWPVRDSALLMSVFFGSQSVGRLVGIPISGFLRPRWMISINLGMTTGAFFLLLFVKFHGILLWIAAAMSGFGMATTNATMILLIAESIPMSGRVMSVLLMGSSVGMMTGPLMVGVLIDLYSPMCLVYILVIFSILHIAIFLLYLWFMGRFKAILASADNSPKDVEVCAETEKISSDFKNLT